MDALCCKWEFRLEEPARAKASQWAEQSLGADARQSMPSHEVLLLTSLMRDLARQVHAVI